MSDIDYKLRRYSPWNWRDFDTLRLEISVGQEYHEGAKLKAATDWARANFNRVVMIVGDTVQGYNIARAGNIALREAFDIARARGDAWLARNARMIEGFDITRWDDWLQHKDYPANRAAVDKLYETNPEFRNHIHDTIEGFQGRHDPFMRAQDRFVPLSKEFLLEETAVFATAYGALGGISAYPGTFLETWGMFVGREVEGAPEGLKNSHWMRLQFRRRQSDTNEEVVKKRIMRLSA